MSLAWGQTSRGDGDLVDARESGRIVIAYLESMGGRLDVQAADRAPCRRGGVLSMAILAYRSGLGRFRATVASAGSTLEAARNRSHVLPADVGP
jgi:hypothetical protein